MKYIHYITLPGKCNGKAIKKEVMFELSLKRRLSVCVVSAGKNIPGRWDKYVEIDFQEYFFYLECSMYKRLIDKEAVEMF